MAGGALRFKTRVGFGNAVEQRLLGSTQRFDLGVAKLFLSRALLGPGFDLIVIGIEFRQPLCFCGSAPKLFCLEFPAPSFDGSLPRVGFGSLSRGPYLSAA